VRAGVAALLLLLCAHTACGVYGPPVRPQPAPEARAELEEEERAP
jgi:hypothetical protein